jgi:4-hydroxy-tetrahydrodipicolinate synthase
MDISTLRGCGTALVTPLNEDQSIDEDSLSRFVEFQVSSGIDFLVPCGTTGESVTLSDEEQHRVVSIVQKAARGRVPVIAGAGGNNTAHVIELAVHFEKMGVDGLLSVTPYYNKPTQEGLVQHFRAVAESTSLPIVGVKEASGDLSQIAEIAARVPPGFKIFSGDDSVTLPVISLGGAGLISVASNEAPSRMAALTRACLENRWDDARRLNRELFSLMKANFIESSPGPVKAALAMMGKIKEVYRLPMVPVKAETREKLRAILTELKLIESKSVQAD